MVVYSYKGERLAEHSYLVLRLYCGAFGTAHERLVAKRLSMSPELVARTLRTACLLHDAGKALTKFQEAVKQERGMPFHEVVSALLVYDTLSLALFGEGPVVRHALSFAAAYAVLQHHQAMRGFREALHSGLTHLLQLGGGIDDGVVEEVKLAARMAEHLFDAGGVLEAFERSVERASREGLCTMLQEFMTTFTNIASGHAPASIALGRSSEWAATWGRLQTALPLFSAPLQLCDYLAAYLARGGRLRALHREALLLLRNASRNLFNLTSASTSSTLTLKPCCLE
jgi:CRISPR-associated endonuclease Cas3-HD